MMPPKIFGLFTRLAICAAAQDEVRNGNGALSRSVPVTWYGGKRRWAPLVWERFGDDVGVYSEPFAGSLAVLLHRAEPVAREIVCDTDGGLCNFWRAVRADPEEVAYWADYPTVHHDLTARHRWLVRWALEHGPRLEADPDYFDARAAGWWVWGISLWIGGGWCQPNYRGQAPSETTPERQPSVQPTGGGHGVSAQTKRLEPHDKRPYVPDHRVGRGVSVRASPDAPHDKIPHLSARPGGRGVTAQAKRREPHDQVPHVKSNPGGQGVSAQRAWDKRPSVGGSNGRGVGVSAQSRAVREQIPKVEHWLGGTGVNRQRRTRPDLLEWFDALAARLYGVVVLNRSWESAVTPTVLQHTPTGPKPPVAVFLDPPYVREGRAKDIYGSDADGSSTDVARAAFEWAVAHGDRYRIAYCAHDGDFELPPGWTVETQSFGGIRVSERRAERRDAIMFSPACVAARQREFDLA